MWFPCWGKFNYRLVVHVCPAMYYYLPTYVTFNKGEQWQVAVAAACTLGDSGYRCELWSNKSRAAGWMWLTLANYKVVSTTTGEMGIRWCFHSRISTCIVVLDIVRLTAIKAIVNNCVCTLAQLYLVLHFRWDRHRFYIQNVRFITESICSRAGCAEVING